MKAILGLLAVACLAIPAHADHCVQNFRGHHHGHRQQQQNYGHGHHHDHHDQGNYQVGSALREEAIAEKAAELAHEKATKAADAKWEKIVAALEAKLLKFRGQGTFTFGGEVGGDVAAVPGDQAGGGATLPDAAALAITRNCVSCHGPQKQDAGLDLTKAISDPRIAAEIGVRVVTDDDELRMPKGGTFADTDEGRADRQALFDYSVSVSKALRRASP